LDEWEQACPTANWGLRGRERIVKAAGVTHHHQTHYLLVAAAQPTHVPCLLITLQTLPNFHFTFLFLFYY